MSEITRTEPLSLRQKVVRGAGALASATVIGVALTNPNVSSAHDAEQSKIDFNDPNLAEKLSAPNAPEPTEVLVEYTVGTGDVAEGIADGLGAKDEEAVERWADNQSHESGDGVYAGDDLVFPANKLTASSMTVEGPLADSGLTTAEILVQADPADGPVPVDIAQNTGQ